MNVRESVTRETLERVEIKLILPTEAIKRRARTNQVRREREYPLGPQSRHFAETKRSERTQGGIPQHLGGLRPQERCGPRNLQNPIKNQILKGSARAQ